MTNYVDPVAANGAVEKWLVQVEDAMLESIRDQSFQWPGEECVHFFGQKKGKG